MISGLSLPSYQKQKAYFADFKKKFKEKRVKEIIILVLNFLQLNKYYTDYQSFQYIIESSGETLIHMIDLFFRVYNLRMRHYIMLSAICSKMYFFKYGMYPDSLSEEEAEYDIPVPIDFFSGEKLKYIKKQYSITIYSVGEDSIDDNGENDDISTTLFSPGQ